MTRASASLLALLALATAARAENWPQWRGPTANGISKETKLPVEWSEKRNLAWTLPMPGIGASTPIVWGDRIFLTSAESPNLLELLCVSTEGKLVWKKKVSTGNARFMKDEANMASASPTTDGKLVWCFFASGELACFDFEGKEIWSFNVQDRYGKFSIQHGIHTTPVLYEDKLFLTLLHANAHLLIALDKATGKEAWKVQRKTDAQGESKEAYTTPCLWREGDEMCLVILGCDYATCHKVADGTEIWRLTELNPKKNYSTAFRIISSPVVNDDLLVVPTARGLQVMGLKAGGMGNVGPGSPSELWRKAKGAPDVPSPLIHDGLVYLCGEQGFLTCLEAKTGKELYKERLHVSRYRASPVYADGNIYLTGRDGNFTVVRAGPRFELLATNSLPDEFTASPAISNGRIYLRGFKTLYAVELIK
jgi:outer membrane protein assembly factor BamB